jgi:putative tryptophan/tyrosine transport system substrate-binding protein
MTRREFIVGIGAAAAWPVTLWAQPRRVYRVGYLNSGTSNPRIFRFFHDGLRELGWIEGQNIMIEYRYAEGRADALPELANELTGLKVDVIVASPTPAALAARNATQTIPIVGIGFDNPVQHGLIASLARPGRNVTGLSYAVGPEIFGKDLELLKELVPGLRTVAVLSNPGGPNHGIIVANVETAARSLGLKPLLFEVRRPEEFDSAFATMAARQAEAIFVVGDPMYGVHQAHRAFATLSAAGRPYQQATRRSRRTDGLWAELSGALASRRCLCRQDPQRLKARRSAGRTTDQVRAGDQLEDRKGAWSHRATDTARPRR